MDETTSTSPSSSDAATRNERRWRPLDRFQRRVLGVLAEKAKTTPDGYPMTISGITTGCNQKSNRSPQMSMTQDQVESVLEQLRGMQAVTEIYSTGRAAKFRHHLYEWLDVRGAEAAVMIELLLRGEQTIGELRGRAARFDESISDVAALKPLLDSLQEKDLIVALTPEGRGQMVTHNLYQPQELEAVRRHVAAAIVSGLDTSEPTSAESPAPQTTRVESNLLQEIKKLADRIARIERELGIAQDSNSEP